MMTRQMRHQSMRLQSHVVTEIHLECVSMMHYCYPYTVTLHLLAVLVEGAHAGVSLSDAVWPKIDCYCCATLPLLPVCV